MTREEAKQLLPIIKAFAEGKTIQFGERDIEEPSFDGPPTEYHIKLEPKYRPFKSQKECWEEMHKHSDFGWVKFCNSICFIQNISFNKITVISDEEICSTSFEGGFTNMKFADGTPFGIKE